MILPGMPRMVGGKKRVPIIALPPMTSNTEPAGHVASASSATTSSPPWRAFDGDATGSQWQSTAVAGPWWVQRSASEQFRVIKYAVCSHSSFSGTCSPTSFQLRGSLDGANWDILDERSGVAWSGGQRQEFSVATPGVYSYYRLHIITVQGASNPARVGELELLQE